MTKQRWTDEMHDRLRREYPTTKDVHGLAAELGVTIRGLRQRAKILKVQRDRPRYTFTAEEIGFVKANYATMTAIEIAARLGRKAESIWRLAIRLGIAGSQFEWTEERIARLRELHAEGWCDAEIAKDLGACRHNVGTVRKKLGLPRHIGGKGEKWHPRQRERHVRETLPKQFATLGVRNPGEIRARSYRRYAAENGWPEDIRPRAVQILNLLAATGVPLTRRQICDGIGMKWKGSRKSLVSNDKKGTYLQALADRGLVVRLGRVCQGEGKGKSSYLYTLGPEALRILQERANGTERQEKQPLASR